MLQDDVCGNNPCSEDNVNESIRDTVFFILPAEFQHVMNIMFVRYDLYLQFKGNHFQRLL
jgi:hypothetical protein